MTDIPTSFANALANKFAKKTDSMKADKIVVGDKTYSIQKNGTPTEGKITIKYCTTNNQPYAVYMDTTPVYLDESACYTWSFVYKQTNIDLNPSTIGISGDWTVYWGDGTSDKGVSGFILFHSYTDGQEEHTVKIDVPFTSLGEGAFQGKAVKEMNFPKQCTSIGKNAFKNDTALRTVSFPPLLTSIGESAFEGCADASGEMVLIAEGLSKIDLPNTCTTIGKNAFKGCYALGDITFGSGLTSIGESAFDMTGSTTALLANGITFKNPTPPVCGTNAFKNYNTDFLTVRVPHGSLNAYKNTPNMVSGDNIFWIEV